MPQLTEDDKTRLKTKLEGLKARIAEIKASLVIEPEAKKQAVTLREKICTDLEAALKPEAMK